jgi:CubicO group peptidase (beta-lactamase class C family)
VRKFLRRVFVWGLLALLATVGAIYINFGTEPIHADAAGIASQGRGAEDKRDWTAAIARAQSAVREGMTAQNLPGLSVAVGVGADIVWASGFGWADIETKTPVGPDMRFRIGTGSQAMSAAAADLLREQGKLGMDDEIQSYFPDYPKKKWPVKLGQIMAGTAGIRSDGGGDGPLYRVRCERPAEAVKHFAGEPLLFEPGTANQPSNYAWVLLSATVEAAAKKPFLAFMRESIWGPLGMGNTGAESASEENPEKIGEEAEDPPFATMLQHLVFQPMGWSAPRVFPPTSLATIYERGWGPRPLIRLGLHPMRTYNLSCYAGAMAFYSAASDLARFGWAMRERKLGWKTREVKLAGKPTRALGPDGEMHGHTVMALRVFPQNGLVVAVLTNAAYGDPGEIALRAADAFLR